MAQLTYVAAFFASSSVLRICSYFAYGDPLRTVHSHRLCLWMLKWWCCDIHVVRARVLHRVELPIVTGSMPQLLRRMGHQYWQVSLMFGA